MNTKRPTRFSQPSSPPDTGTYWGSVLSQPDEYPRGCFVAVGFDMWVVWSQIIAELRQPANIKIFIPDYDFHGSPSFRSTVPNYVSVTLDGQTTSYTARPTVSTAKWQPKLEERQLNPWLDITNFIPNCLGLPPRPFRFTSLPIELGQRIASLLPSESAAALSVTSRAMYRLIPPQLICNLSVSERWKLMLLLERDSDILIACQACLKLHSPFQRQDAPCQRQWQVLLPAGVTPALCRLLAKHYIRRTNYSDLLCMAGQTKIHTSPDFKAVSHSTLRMIDGNLFVRVETHIVPLTAKGELTGYCAYLFNSIADGRSCQICPHVRWSHLGVGFSSYTSSEADRYSSLSALYLGRQLPNKSYLRDQLYGKDPFKDQLYELDHRIQNPCSDGDLFTSCGSFCRRGDSPWAGFHTRQCYSSIPIAQNVLDRSLRPTLICALFHHQPCTERECSRLPGRFRVNQVRACEICATDMCVGAQDVAGAGRVISLTTWKKLGGVYAGQWANWYPHSADVGKFTRDFVVTSQFGQITRDLSKGTAIYAEFENPTPTRGPAQHTSQMTDRIVAALSGIYEAEKPNWSGEFSPLHLDIV